MISSLHISNYVLIDSLDIEFPGGLIIITGQTGAGKSILLGALSLLLGGKADASVLSEGADTCVVEAEFSLDDNEALNELLESMDVDADGKSLTIRRVVNRTGRSRSFVNDCPVTLPSLLELSAFLIDIHSQHASLLLTDKKYQLSVLDSFAGNAELLESTEVAWKEMKGIESELEALILRQRASASERDYNEAQWKQLVAASLKEGELEELEAEQKLLANAEQIQEALTKALVSVGNDDDRTVQAVPGALKEASRALSSIERFIPSTAELSSRMESARIEIEDITEEIEKLYGASNFSPERLQFVDERIGLLYQLMTKHSCPDIAALISLRDSLASEFSDAESLEDKIAEMNLSLKAAKDVYAKQASALSEARTKAAKLLAEAISSNLHFLELDRSVFEVRISPSEPTKSGLDSVTFLFSSNGTAPADLSKCASGGEMSRIMLSLKAVMAGKTAMPTMIFDEIDTGVSGSVADKMGSMICEMGNTMQVIAITHLPQVAAKGTAHYLVRKSEGIGGTMRSGISRLEGDERVMEIARLLSGASITPQAVANARSLMDAD